MNTTTHLDFMALQVKDMSASKKFYHEILGFELSEYQNPEATVFKDDTGAIFAIRNPLFDLSQFNKLGAGVSIWFGWKESVEGTLKKLKAHNVPIIKEPFDTPFGKSITVADPDGYMITLHEIE